MELSRRDALAALAAAGVTAGGAFGVSQLRERDDEGREPNDQDGEGNEGFDESEVATLTSVAEVLYPSEVDGIRTFVETYASGRADARPEYADEVGSALQELDLAAEDWHAAPYRELDYGTRDSLLRELGCDTADPVPAGTTAEQLRYYLVNELQFALYTSPTGGRLVGVENPQGHPGGTTSYQRGPDR